MYFKDPEPKAQAVIIWLHGLGSNPQDMEGLALELGLSAPVRHIFLAAPIRPVTINQGLETSAWYDIYGMNFQDRDDLEGMTASMESVHQAIHQQLVEGFANQNIFIAGFSQGAALALFAGLSYPATLGGLLVLSGYLPCRNHLSYVQDKNIPIFFGMGRYDDLVLPLWTEQSIQHIKNEGYSNLQVQNYAMGHSVCPQEIRDMSAWLNAHIE
jgi:phospholipase/carboxylesterase